MQIHVTRQKRLYVIYRCSKCGEIQKQEVHVQKSGDYDTAFTMRTTEKRKLKKAIELDLKIHKLCEELVTQPSVHTFVRSSLTCRCPSCHMKQPWARFHTLLLLIALLELSLCSAAMIAALIRRDFTWQVRQIIRQVLPWALSLLAVFELGALLYTLIMRLWTKKILRELPPLFAYSEADLHAKAASIAEYAHAFRRFQNVEPSSPDKPLP